MPQGSTSMNYASVLAIFTPKVASFAQIAWQANVFLNEEEFLGETQPDGDRARQFMSNDGSTSQYIDKFAISGRRDLSVIAGPEADQLKNWAYSNPQPVFDMAFTYQRNDQDTSEIRTYLHKDCKIMNQPARVLSNDIVLVKFTLKYGNIRILDATGNQV